MDIILARHGETQWNAGEIFRGRADVELNETGKTQARLAGEYLSGDGIAAVYSSPLKRALETARAIAVYHRVEVVTDDRLNDLDFGEWEGLTVPDVKARYGDLFAVWERRPESVRLPGGETLDDVKQRALDVVHEVAHSHSGTVVIVTHRVVFKVLVCVLLGLDNSHFWDVLVDTCGLTTFQHRSGRFILKAHNDTSFLRSLPTKRLADF